MIQKKEIFWYCVVGTTATILYFFIRFTTKSWTENLLIPVILGQLAAIFFSFFANKFFVFKNIGIGIEKSLQQFFEFLIGRLAVAALDILITYVFVGRYPERMIDLLHLNRLDYHQRFFMSKTVGPYIGTPILLNEFIFTVFSQILATVINYMVSKYIVFNATKETTKVCT